MGINRDKGRYSKAVFAGLLAAGFLIRVLFAFITPAWEAPDEYPHYWYAEQIALEGILPRSVHEFPAYEAYQPPLYYLAASVLIKLGDEKLAFSPEPMPPPQPLVLVRLLSVVFGVLTLWISFQLFGLIPGISSSVRLWGVGFMAFLPTFVGVNSSVNNDSLVVLLAALCLFFIIRKPWTARTAFIGGLLAGLALLTKINALALLPLVVFAAVYAADYRPSKAAQWLSLFFAGWMICAAVLLGRNVGLYGEVLALNPGAETGGGLALANAIRASRNLTWSFWLAFGRTYLLVLPPIVYVLTAFPLMLLAFYGWLRLQRQHRELMVMTLVAAASFVFGSLWYTFSYPPGTMTSWGKNVFPILPLLAIFLVLGWQASIRRFSGLVPGVGIGVMAAGCLWALIRLSGM